MLTCTKHGRSHVCPTNSPGSDAIYCTEGSEGAYFCAEQLSRLQSYHTAFLKMMVCSEDDGSTAPTEVAFVVTETRVRVVITVRRRVQSVPGSRLQDFTEAVTACDAQGGELRSEPVVGTEVKVISSSALRHTRAYGPRPLQLSVIWI